MATQLLDNYKSGACKLLDHPSPLWSMAVSSVVKQFHYVIVKRAKVGKGLIRNEMPFSPLVFHIVYDGISSSI